MSLIFKQLFERESCTYTYLIADSDSKEAAIVDAVDIMMDRDKALLEELELDLKFIIETHIHADHITSACPLKKYYPKARIVIGMENVDAEACSDIMVSEGHILNIGQYQITTIETPGHTKGHMSVIAEVNGEKVLLAGDAMPESGTVSRGLPYNVFWDVADAQESVEKMVAASNVFYPGHDRPFRVEGDEINYLEGPENIHVIDSTEGGGTASLTFTVAASRTVNVDIVQK